MVKTTGNILALSPINMHSDFLKKSKNPPSLNAVNAVWSIKRAQCDGLSSTFPDGLNVDGSLVGSEVGKRVGTVDGVAVGSMLEIDVGSEVGLGVLGTEVPSVGTNVGDDGDTVGNDAYSVELYSNSTDSMMIGESNGDSMDR